MNQKTQYTLGIDIGSTTVKIAILSEDGEVLFSDYERHFANIQETLSDLLGRAVYKLGAIYASPVITGSGGLTLAKNLGIPFVQEVIAVSTALQDYAPQTDVAIELGGEDAKIIYFEGGNVEQRMNGVCAGGTGSFIDQMASLLQTDASGLNEYELNLEVSLKLRDELTARGYEVYMIRETNDVNISNKERAELAAASGADILVRIHANGSENTSVQGALTMAPSSGNPYVGELAGTCQELSQDIIDAFCAATGANNQGVYITDDMSGINWSTIPVTIVEMGYMTNPDEDLRMASDEYQAQMVQGIANGIDAYFAGQ